MFEPVEVTQARRRRLGPAAEELHDTPSRLAWVDELRVAVDPDRRYPWPRLIVHLNPYQVEELADLVAESGVEPSVLLLRLYREQPESLRRLAESDARPRGRRPAVYTATPAAQ
jgi:hypothetical protein